MFLLIQISFKIKYTYVLIDNPVMIEKRVKSLQEINIETILTN